MKVVDVLAIGLAAMAALVPVGASAFDNPQAPALSATAIQRQAAELSGQAPALNHLGMSGNPIHILPNLAGQAAREAAGLTGRTPSTVSLLTYHAGGSIMSSNVLIYNIYWLPSTAKLQNGTATSFSASYQSINNGMAAQLPGHGLLAIATQYYQTISSTTTYITNAGGLGGTYVDTAAYPASGCTDSITPGNCVTDAQIITELKRVMALNGWTGGMNKIYMMYTSSGEGSCFATGSSSCAYTAYCAYHSYTTLNNSYVIYGNIPYGSQSYCQGSATMPNLDVGDLAANVATHEIIEAATDPLLNAWFDAGGNEIGDKCAWTFGTNSWTNPSTNVGANLMYSGKYFEFQQEFSNHTSNCLLAGP